MYEIIVNESNAHNPVDSAKKTIENPVNAKVWAVQIKV